jgi:hypothetical protein
MIMIEDVVEREQVKVFESVDGQVSQAKVS